MAGQEEDLYLVLGLEKGLESTEADVKKAYRKKALESHPDKRPNDKNAASEFDRIQKAYEVLGDEKARKAYDDLRKVQKARADRDAQKGAKRQRMMDDLKRREETFQHERSAEELAKMKLKAEIARVRQENIARQKRQQQELAAAQEEARRSSGGAASTPGAGSTLLQGATLARTLKVTWDRVREGGVEDYGAEKLRKVFTRFGPVEDVIIKEDVKKKKKGSALVVLGTEGAAAAAIEAVCGDLSNPLLVKPAVPGVVPSAGQANAQASGANGLQVSGVNGEQTGGANRGQTSGVDGRQASDVHASQGEGVHRSETSSVNGAQVGGKNGGASGEGEERADIHGAGAAPQGKPSTSSDGGASQRPNIFANGPPRPLFGGTGASTNPTVFSGAAVAASSGSHKDYENVTLMRMRQAAERARLIREMEEQDAREANAEKGG